MNAPALHDRFIVPEGMRKVDFVPDTKVVSAGTFTVQREDHTLGNLIRMCAFDARLAVPDCPGATNP
jgi:DNA-directed RNA polymerase II subunit RPB11